MNTGAAFYPPCRDNRDACFGAVRHRGDKKCRVLIETYKVGEKCPFYKESGKHENENDENKDHTA